MEKDYCDLCGVELSSDAHQLNLTKQGNIDYQCFICDKCFEELERKIMIYHN